MRRADSGGAAGAAAGGRGADGGGPRRAVEQLVLRARPLLGEALRTLPPLPHGVPALDKARAPGQPCTLP